MADADLSALFERLDRLPLAIELCAGRLGVLTLDEVMEHTELDFLRSSRQGRHQTLRATLAQSWELLDADERRALQALAAFRGSVDIEGAESVFAGLGAPLGLLDALTQRSLLRAEGRRFEVLATVRGYVEEEGEELPWAEERHGAFLARFGDDAGRVSLRSQRWRQLAASLSDVWLACQRAVARGDGATATSCLRAWWAVAALRGPFAPSTRLAEQVLTCPGLTDEERTAATVVRGHAQRLHGTLAEALDTLTEALDAADLGGFLEVGLEGAVALAPVYAGRSRHEEAPMGRDLARSMGATQRVSAAALGLAQTLAQRGDTEGSEAALEEAATQPNADPVDILLGRAGIALSEGGPSAGGDPAGGGQSSRHGAAHRLHRQHREPAVLNDPHPAG